MKKISSSYIVRLKSRAVISSREQEALQLLAKKLYVTVRAAEKGEAVVLLDSDLYRRLNMEMLGDEEAYRYLSCNHTCAFQNKLKKLLSLGVSMAVLTQS